MKAHKEGSCQVACEDPHVSISYRSNDIYHVSQTLHGTAIYDIIYMRRGIYFWNFVCFFFGFFFVFRGFWLLAFVASGFCGFWLLWLLAFVAFGFRGFCGFWLFGLSIYLSIPIYLSIYLSFFLLAAVLPSLFVFAFPVVFVAETKPNKEASKQASTSCSPLDLVCCWGGRCAPPNPPRATKSALHPRHPRLPRKQYFKVNSPVQNFLTKQICLLYLSIYLSSYLILSYLI